MDKITRRQRIGKLREAANHMTQGSHGLTLVPPAIERVEFARILSEIQKASDSLNAGAMSETLINLAAFMDTLVRLKPTTSKGTYLKGIHLSTTMGPGIPVDTSDVKNLVRLL